MIVVNLMDLLSFSISFGLGCYAGWSSFKLVQRYKNLKRPSV